MTREPHHKHFFPCKASSAKPMTERDSERDSSGRFCASKGGCDPTAGLLRKQDSSGRFRARRGIVLLGGKSKTPASLSEGLEHHLYPLGIMWQLDRNATAMRSHEACSVCRGVCDRSYTQPLDCLKTLHRFYKTTLSVEGGGNKVFGKCPAANDLATFLPQCRKALQRG